MARLRAEERFEDTRKNVSRNSSAIVGDLNANITAGLQTEIRVLQRGIDVAIARLDRDARGCSAGLGGIFDHARKHLLQFVLLAARAIKLLL